jgi:hypothetical protein
MDGEPCRLYEVKQLPAAGSQKPRR